MAIKRLRVNNFTGGISEGTRVGYDGSFNDSLALDFTTDPDKLQVRNKLKLDHNPTSLPKWVVEASTDQYWYGANGVIERRKSDGTWAYNTTISNSNGNGIGYFNSKIFYANDTNIGTLDTPNAVTPTKTDNYFVSNQQEFDQTSTGTGNTYTTPIAISEAAADKRTFTPTVANTTGIAIVLGTRGTGNITLTLHDASNNVVGVKTLQNADIDAGTQLVRFNFDGFAILTPASAYHFHVTSTVADGTVQTLTANDLSVCEFHQLRDFRKFDVDQSNDLSDSIISSSSSNNTYTVLTGIIETDVNRREFVPDKTYLTAISIPLQNRGTGNITVTLHNENNVSQGSVTVTNATITSTRPHFYRFSFASPIKLIPGETYHFHVTSTVADARVFSTTDSDLSDGGFLTHFPILLDNDLHMMKVHLNKLAIGNGNFLATIDDSELYDPEAIQFPEGENVRCLETIGDYLAISTWVGDDLSSRGRSNLYLWDGISPTYNSFVPVDGQVNAMRTYNNNLYVIHGTQNHISVYTGALTLLRKLKYVNQTSTVFVNPGAIDTWEGVLMWGVTGGTADIDHAIYSIGKKNKDYPTALNKEFRISTGSMASTVEIGAILGISATQFFVGWKDGSTYGIDIIDTANKETEAYVQLLRFDGKEPNMEKVSKSISMRCDPLEVYQKIEIWYKINNSGNFIYYKELNGASSEDLIGKSFPFNERFYEIEWLFYLKTSGANSPTILSFEMLYDEKSEAQFGEIFSN